MKNTFPLFSVHNQQQTEEEEHHQDQQEQRQQSDDILSLPKHDISRPTGL